MIHDAAGLVLGAARAVTYLCPSTDSSLQLCPASTEWLKGHTSSSLRLTSFRELSLKRPRVYDRPLFVSLERKSSGKIYRLNFVAEDLVKYQKRLQSI